MLSEAPRRVGQPPQLNERRCAGTSQAIASDQAAAALVVDSVAPNLPVESRRGHAHRQCQLRRLRWADGRRWSDKVLIRGCESDAYPANWGGSRFYSLILLKKFPKRG